MIAPTCATAYAMIEAAAPAGTVTEAFAWMTTAAALGTSGRRRRGRRRRRHGRPGRASSLAGAAALAVAAVVRPRAHPLTAVAEPRDRGGSAITDAADAGGTSTARASRWCSCTRAAPTRAPSTPTSKGSPPPSARYRFDRRGQGRTPDLGGPITFAEMTDDTIAFIETVVGEPVHLLGHSIGAPVGLLVAPKRPDLVRGLVFSEGVFHFDGWLPGVLDPLPPDVLEFLGGLYAEVSPHGAEHWPAVWQRLDAEHHARAGAHRRTTSPRSRRRRC